MKEYKTCAAEGVDLDIAGAELKELVSNMLRRGWECQSGVVLATCWTGQEVWYVLAQAMVRDDYTDGRYQHGYTPAGATDIRKTFARARKELAAAAMAAPPKVVQIKRRKP